MTWVRRGGVGLRPLPFVVGWILVVLGLLRGLGWLWSMSRFSGNILVRVVVPRDLLTLGPAHWIWLGVGAFGVFLILWSHTRPTGLAPALPLMDASRTFYPFVAALGLFVTTFGLVYLFDVSVSATTAPGGYATFVFLEYANLFARPVQSTFGLLVTLVGGAALSGSVGGRRVPLEHGAFQPVAPTGPRAAE